MYHLYNFFINRIIAVLLFSPLLLTFSFPENSRSPWVRRTYVVLKWYVANINTKHDPLKKVGISHLGISKTLKTPGEILFTVFPPLKLPK